MDVNRNFLLIPVIFSSKLILLLNPRVLRFPKCAKHPSISPSVPFPLNFFPAQGSDVKRATLPNAAAPLFLIRRGAVISLIEFFLICQFCRSDNSLIAEIRFSFQSNFVFFLEFLKIILFLDFQNLNLFFETIKNNF